MGRIAAVVFLLIIGACCREKSVVTHHYKVTAEQKEALPHKMDSSYTFLAPNNQPFAITYFSEKTTENYLGGDHCGDSYLILDIYYRNFQSTVPDLFVSFGLQGDFSASVSVAINKNQFGIITTLAPDLDTITINGVLYQDVYTPTTLYADSATLYFDKIWYNQSHGLLQFTTNNGQVFKRQ